MTENLYDFPFGTFSAFWIFSNFNDDFVTCYSTFCFIFWDKNIIWNPLIIWNYKSKFMTIFKGTNDLVVRTLQYSNDDTFRSVITYALFLQTNDNCIVIHSRQ